MVLRGSPVITIVPHPPDPTNEDEILERIVRLYPAIEKAGIVESLIADLKVEIENFKDAAREEGWADGYFEAGGLGG